MKIPKSKFIALYLVWILILVILALNSMKDGWGDSEGFFPIDNIRYFGFSEVILYSLLPLILAYIYHSFVKKDKLKSTIEGNLSLNNSHDTNLVKESINPETTAPLETPTRKSRKTIISKSLFYFLLLGFGSSYYYLSQLYNENVNLFSQNAEYLIFTIVPSMIGSAIGLGIIPLCVIIYKKIKKREITGNSYLIYVLVNFICYVFALRGVYVQYSSKYSSLDQTERVATYIYHQSGNEYKIIFPKTPAISKMSTNIGGVILDGENAEVLLLSDKSFLRCENFCYGSKQFVVSEEACKTSLAQVAQAYGLRMPTILYEGNSKYGKVFTLNGHKFIQDKGKSYHSVMYQVRWYFGDNSAMLLTVASEANIFPTNAISNFINSISKNG